VQVKVLWCLLLSLCVILTGCSTDSGGAVVYFEGNDLPQTVDPLLAATDDELLAVWQLYEPLLELQNGKFVGRAADYTVSADRLTYTFTLRDGAWSNGQSLTADDFVFQLQRAVDPRTQATCAWSLMSVQGAQQVYAGSVDPKTIGVKVVDDRTFTVTLTTPDQGILSALAGVAGMPCNRGFFEDCGGRYGMGKDYVLTNGPFMMGGWSTHDKDLYLRLTKNEYYRQTDSVAVGGVTLRYQSADGRVSRVVDQAVDVGRVSGSTIQSAQQQGLSVHTVYEDSLALVFNDTTGGATADDHFRRALIGGIDWSAVPSYLPEWCQLSHSLVLPGRYCGNSVYSGVGINQASLSGNLVQSNFSQAMTKLTADQVSNLTLCYRENPDLRRVLDFIIQCWQKQFGIHVSLTAVSAYELSNRMTSGEFDIVLTTMGNAGDQPMQVLGQFAPDVLGPMMGLGGPLYRQAWDEVKGKGNTSAAWQACERALWQECVAVPVLYTKGAYVCNQDLTDVTIDPFTQFPKLENAKKSNG